MLLSESGNKGFISLWSSASFLPSFVILSILSSVASTVPDLIFSALSPKAFTISCCISLGFTTTFIFSNSGVGKFNVSAVWISATSLNIDISSGKLWNFANLVFALYPVPSGASSIAVTVSPNVLAQLSKCSKLFSFNPEYCKYLCIV